MMRYEIKQDKDQVIRNLRLDRKILLVGVVILTVIVALM